MERVELDRLELEKKISQLLSQAFLELDEGERQLMKRYGLSLTQFWALFHLENEEGRSFTELADLLICDKSNVTSIVDQFEKKGLAERKPGRGGDRRYISVVLTPQGKQLRATLIAAQEHLLKQRLQMLDDAHLQHLYKPLQHVTSTLRAQFNNDEVSTMIDNSIEHAHLTSEASAVAS